MERSLFIFEHKKGFLISIENQILIALTGFFFLFSFLEHTENFDFGNLITYLGIIWLITLAGVLISNFFLNQHKNGEFKGKIEFKKNTIKINEVSYKLDEIAKISINALDYEGQFIRGTFEFTRHISNGLNNRIIIKLKNGNEIKRHFFQSKGQRIKNFRDILTLYHLEGKISWLHLLDILEIEDYKEIQKFKNNLKNK